MYDAPSPLLLSRVAESAYWAGRYLERAEGTARVLRTHADLMLDLPRSSGMQWASLLATIGADAPATATEDEVAKFLAADTDNPSSIVRSVAAVHHNLRITRAVVPIEAAEVLTELHHLVRDTADEAVDRTTRRRWLTDVIHRCQTLSGMLVDTMSHDDAFCFFTVGRQLERADLTTRVIDVQAGLLTGTVNEDLAPWAGICWAAALRSVSALQAFRRRGIGSSGKATVAFLLSEETCPRSVRACLNETARRLSQIPRSEDPLEAWTTALVVLATADIGSMFDEGGLHDYIDDLQIAIGGIHTAIHETWFAPALTTART